MINSLTNISDISKEFGTTLTSKNYTYFYNNRNLESPVQPNTVNVKSWIGYDHNYVGVETWGDWYWIGQYQCSGTTRQKRQQRDSSLGNHKYRWVTWEVNSVECGYVPPVEVWGDWYYLDYYKCSGTTKQRQQQRDSNKGNTETKWVTWEVNSVDCGYVPPVEVWGDWYWIEQYQCSETTRQKQQQRDSSFGNHQYQWTDIEYNSLTCGYVPETWGDWYWIDRYMCRDTNTQMRQQQRDSNKGNHEYNWVVWDTQSVACGWIPPKKWYCPNCGIEFTREPPAGITCWNCGWQF